MEFKFDDAAFKRELTRMKGTIATEAERHIRRLIGKTIAELRMAYVGRPVDEIKPAVVDAWRRNLDGDISDPELTRLATAISTGADASFDTEIQIR